VKSRGVVIRRMAVRSAMVKKSPKVTSLLKAGCGDVIHFKR